MWFVLTENKKTSIKIKPEVWKQLKISAIKNNQTISELTQQIITNYLATQDT